VSGLVASGRYHSPDEVLREAVHLFQEREARLAGLDAAGERRLREDVAPTYDAHKANPEKASPLADVAARVDAFMDAAEQTTR
jgi:antitoxin ParD1/3/4